MISTKSNDGRIVLRVRGSSFCVAIDSPGWRKRSERFRRIEDARDYTARALSAGKSVIVTVPRYL